jgi:translation elongation factor EF-Ts
MKDVTLKNDKVMTDAEYVNERGGGDALTDFVATKHDLISLADKLVDELLSAEFYLELCASLNELRERDYLRFRLNRVLDFLPDHEAEIREKLRVGREKNDTDVEKVAKS